MNPGLLDFCFIGSHEDPMWSVYNIGHALIAYFSIKIIFYIYIQFYCSSFPMLSNQGI